MFPSAVTALTGAGRSRSLERAGRERARLRERGVGGGGDQGLGGLCGIKARPGARESAGVGGVRARDPESGSEAASCGARGRGDRTGRPRGGV